MVVTEIQLSEKFQVLKFSRAEYRIEVVSQKVVSKKDDLKGVLDSIKQTFGESPNLEMKPFENCNFIT